MPSRRPVVLSTPRWDVKRARLALGMNAGLGDGLMVREDGWHVIVRACGQQELRRSELSKVHDALASAGFVGMCQTPSGVSASAGYPATALTRSVGSPSDFCEAVSFDGHPQRAGGTVALHPAYASAVLVAADASGREIGRGYHSRRAAVEDLARHCGLSGPVRLVDEDRLPADPQVRTAVLAVTAAALRAEVQAAMLHPHGELPVSATPGDVEILEGFGLIAGAGGACSSWPWAVTELGRRVASAWPREQAVVIPCSYRKEPLPAGPAGVMYARGSYHRAARRAAQAMTAGGGQWAVLSAKYGLLRPQDVILTYDLRAGQPGTVSGQVLARQAHHMAISGALVTVLAGQAYGDLVSGVWPQAHRPLSGMRGIGEHLRYFAARGVAARTLAADTGRS